MAVSKKPTKAKSKAHIKAVKPKAVKPAAKKAAPAKKPLVAKKKPAVAKKSLPAKKPIEAKTSTPKKPVPAAKPVSVVKTSPPARPRAVVSPVKSSAVPPPSGATKPKAVSPPKAPALPPRPEPPEIIPPVPVVGSDYMNPAQREFYRKLLLNQRNELTAELEQTIHHMQDENVNLPDPNDRASQEADMTLELRSRDRETKLIHKIDEAIARLEAGEYGYCESCGEPIGRGRLEARPTATLCIDCKRLDEIRERQVA